MKMSNYHTSMAGECYVLAQLFVRGYTASLTYGNAKRVDIFVSTKSGTLFRLEVKTTGEDRSHGSDKSQFGQNYEWRMKKKNEDEKSENLYYCFVMLRGENQVPRFFICKSQEVSEYLKSEYKFYHNLKRNREVKKTEMRRFRIGLNQTSHGLKPNDNYENRWDILPQ